MAKWLSARGPCRRPNQTGLAGWTLDSIGFDWSVLHPLQTVQIVTPLGIPVPDLLLPNLLLLVHEQRPKDDGPSRTTQLLDIRIPALAHRIWPKEIRLGRIVGIQCAQKIKVRLGSQTIRLRQRRGTVVELIGRLDVQQGVRHLLLLRCSHCRRHRCRQNDQDQWSELQGRNKEGMKGREHWYTSQSEV